MQTFSLFWRLSVATEVKLVPKIAPPKKLPKFYTVESGWAKWPGWSARKGRQTNKPGWRHSESGKQEAAFDSHHCCRTEAVPLKTFLPEKVSSMIIQTKSQNTLKKIILCSHPPLPAALESDFPPVHQLHRNTWPNKRWLITSKSNCSDFKGDIIRNTSLPSK